MLFNSLEYLIFLPAAFIIYWALRRSVLWQHLFIIGASYIFYGWWDWRYLALIGGYTTWAFCAGVLLGKTSGATRKAVMWASVAINLGVLGAYKYFDFFAASLSRLLQSAGVHTDWATLNLVLPVGISFFTFQALGYIIDVYRGKVAPCRDVTAFFAFVSFFPQLVAGPIERADALLPQFRRERTFRYGEAVTGMKQILWGLFKKMVIADNCSHAVSYIFHYSGELGWENLALGALFFTFQIYGDFSGYSDIAIGSARLLGIRLVDNFIFPFFSRNVSELWRRWHRSLNQWFTDYVYIPLGGSREGTVTTVRNLLIVFGLSGLWHGASWTYVAWGLFNGCAMIIYLFYRRTRKPLSHTRHPHGRLRAILSTGSTFAVLCVGFVIFRCHSISHAASYLLRMFTLQPGTAEPYKYTASLLCYIGAFILIEFMNRHRAFGFDFPHEGVLRHRTARWALCWLTAMATFILAVSSSDFIYFQF